MDLHNRPLAYFITFTCHGTWLHGDERGSVDREHNELGTPFLSADSERLQQEADACDPYSLDPDHRTVALQAIVHLADKKGWSLWAVHVRSNHVHVVVAAEGNAERMMNDIKAAISRQLNRAYPSEQDRKRWTRHGSTRYLWIEEQVEAAVRYTVEGQGAAMAVFDGRVKS
jgi:REP element-mobilizing transposase RayT